MEDNKQTSDSKTVSKESNPQLIKKSEMMIILVLIIVAVCAIVVFLLARDTSGKNHLIFTIGGQVEEVFDLSKYEKNTTIDLSADYGVTAVLEFENYGARFINVNCPDHICEKAGWVANITEGAVCIPNRMSVRVVSDQELKDMGEVE